MQALPQLLCLPPAGTGPSLYYPWTLRHRDRVDIHPVSLPGRETRIGEPLPGSLDELADQLADQLAPRLARRYALFGYSMGAVLAYEVARRWARRGLPAPEMIFILGCNPPDRLLEGSEPLHTLESTAFWQAITDLGGTPREILETPEALTLFEPIVRNDFRICETYRHRPDGTRLDCAAHAFVADRDTLVDAETALGWRAFVGGAFTLHALQGNHMLERDAFASLLDTLVAIWLDPARRGHGERHRTYAI
jgi:surfactin synthase thioesterase subunit